MAVRGYLGKPKVTAIKLKDGRAVGVSAGDQIRILPHGGYKGNRMVLSVSTTDLDVRRFLLSALPDCTVSILNYGDFLRSEIVSVFEYKG